MTVCTRRKRTDLGLGQEPIRRQQLRSRLVTTVLTTWYYFCTTCLLLVTSCLRLCFDKKAVFCETKCEKVRNSEEQL